MAESVEIPVQIEGLDKAIRDLERMNRTVAEGAKEGKKELGQIEQMMRRQLSTEILAEGISRIGNAAGGATKNVADLLSAGIKGFAGGGPWGAAFAVASVGVSALIDKLQEGEVAAAKMAEEAAKKTREYAAALADVTKQLGEQIELQRIEAGLRGAGFDEAAVAALTPLLVLDEKVLATRRQIDALEDEIASAVTASDARIEGLGGRGNIDNLASNIRASVAESDAAIAGMRERQQELLRSLSIQEEAQAAKRTEQARKETTERITTETDAAKSAREARDKLHDDEVMQRALRNAAAIEAEEAAEERRRQRRIKRENEAEAKELAARREARAADEAAEIEASQRASAAADRRLEEDRARAQELHEWETRLQREAADIATAIDDEIESSARAAFGDVSQIVGGAVASLAMYSRAAAEANEAQAIGAAETAANVATQVQAILSGIAQESTVKALFQAAEAIAAFATGNIPGGTAHAIAAGKYALIAGGAAGVGAAIGGIRGQNTEEREAKEDAAIGAVRDARSSIGGSAGGGSSGGSGSSDRGGGPTFIMHVGAGVFATRDELGRDMRRLLEAQTRRV